MIYLNNFFNPKKRIVTVCFLTVIFSLFFMGLSFYQQAQAKSKTLNLVIGKYECTKNADCVFKGEGTYCDIDNHVCLQCPKEEDQTHCPDKEPGCDSDKDCPENQKCLNRICVQCTDDSECPDEQICNQHECTELFKCKTNADCPEELPYCQEDGRCGKCPIDKPLVYMDPQMNMRICVGGCETNEDCKDIQRPFCRLGEGENGKGICGCPDKTYYLPEWQTCGYKFQVSINGYGGGGRKGIWKTWLGTDTYPNNDADYTMYWSDPKVNDWIYVYKGTKDDPKKEKVKNPKKQYIKYEKGSTFRMELWNAGDKNDYTLKGTFYFLYEVIKFSEKQCEKRNPVMLEDGRCQYCDQIPDGTAVLAANYCHICSENEPMYSTHSSKKKIDNVCRKCASEDDHYYAEQEECLSCDNTFYRADDKQCFDCAYTDTVSNVTLEECTRCPNRKWTAYMEALPYLGKCTPCKAGLKVDNTGGTCSQCDDANPIAKYNTVTTGCTNCENLTNGTRVETAEDCHKCGENTWYSGYTSDAKNGHFCRPCEMGDDEYHLSTKSECDRCKNTALWKSYNNHCIGCNYTKSIEKTTFEECKRCPNRYWNGAADGTGYGSCIKCPTGATSSDGFACGCTEQEVKLKSKKCITCEDIKSDEIDVASDISDIAQRCQACNYMYKSYNKTCHNCNKSASISNTTEEECMSCPNRYWVGGTNACNLCPDTTETTGSGCVCNDENPIALADTNKNGCRNCDALTEGTKVATPEDCHKCGENVWYATHSDSSKTDNVCRSCEMGDKYYYAEETECNSCDSTLWKRKTKQCFSCNYTKSIENTTKDECEKCSNRSWNGAADGTGYGTCRLCTSGECDCQADKVQTMDGKCKLCPELTNGTIVSNVEQCHKCPDWIGTTYNQCYQCSTQSILNVSKAECNLCSNHLWRSSDSTCYTCSYPYKMYNTTKAECDTCPGRTWEETDAENHLGFCWPATK